MSEKWYLLKNGQQTGPYSKEQVAAFVKTGEVTPHTQVWTEGMSRWIQASQLRWLYGHQQASPPPAPTSPHTEQVNSTPNQPVQASKKRNSIALIAIIITALALLYIFYSLVSDAINKKNILNSEVYALAMEHLLNSQESVDYLGLPIEVSKVNGSIETKNGGGTASISIALEGSNSNSFGFLFVRATRTDGAWFIRKLDFVSAEGRYIYVLKTESE